MTDFQVTTEKVGTKIDTRWRASKHGQDVARPAQLDPTAFVSGTHYNIGGGTDNVIPSGVAVAKLSSGLYGPFDAEAGEAGDPRRVLAGYINDDSGVPLGATPSTAKPTFALLVVGIIKPSVLPVAAQRTAVIGADTTGSFVNVTD